MIIFLILAAICSAIQDTLQHHWYSSVFSLNKNSFWSVDSWKNKYKCKNPNLGEEFPGSTTVFVMFTDLFHLAKFIQIISLLLCIFLPIVHITNIDVLDYIIYYIIYGSVFELFYSKILRI